MIITSNMPIKVLVKGLSVTSNIPVTFNSK
jgi:hypothetical protein